MQTSEEEQLQFDIKANLKRRFEYVGGHLKITNQNLYFTPHAVNVQKKDLTIAIADIDTAETAKILGISPNGAAIHLKDGTEHIFTIGLPGSSENKKVIEYINSLL